LTYKNEEKCTQQIYSNLAMISVEPEQELPDEYSFITDDNNEEESGKFLETCDFCLGYVWSVGGGVVQFAMES
jgi:hypothetical protein